jgi:hypothetical protein
MLVVRRQKEKMKRIDIPKSVVQRPGSKEMVSIWTNGQVNDYVIDGLGWKDSAAWGLLLVDLARHISKMYAQHGQNENDVLKRIKMGFDAEWNAPTDNLEPR